MDQSCIVCCFKELKTSDGVVVLQANNSVHHSTKVFRASAQLKRLKITPFSLVAIGSPTRIVVAGSRIACRILQTTRKATSNSSSSALYWGVSRGIQSVSPEQDFESPILAQVLDYGDGVHIKK